MQPDTIHQLARLSHHRWSLPILAELQRAGGGVRFVVLLNALNLSRDSLTKTLTWLDGEQLAIRNLGYGHPLRPEYVLTDAGRRTAEWAGRVLIEAGELREPLLHKWATATLGATKLTSGGFNAIRACLGAITPRALTASLQRLGEIQLLTRTIIDRRPPGVCYALTPRGGRLVDVVLSL